MVKWLTSGNYKEWQLLLTVSNIVHVGNTSFPSTVSSRALHLLFTLALHHSCLSKTGVLNHPLFASYSLLYIYSWLWLPQLFWVGWYFSIHFLSSRVSLQLLPISSKTSLSTHFLSSCLFYQIACFYHLSNHNEKNQEAELYSQWMMRRTLMYFLFLVAWNLTTTTPADLSSLIWLHTCFLFSFSGWAYIHPRHSLILFSLFPHQLSPSTVLQTDMFSQKITKMTRYCTFILSAGCK